VLFKQIVDHGSRRGDTARELARWMHPVAYSEALDVLYPEMRPELYRCITWQSKLPAIRLHFCRR
jgi:hypothetical protein